MILSSILQAIGLFIATNIDDIIIVSLFFARGSGQRGRRHESRPAST